MGGIVVDKRPYSIGLDIGTNSVGWAVIYDNYKLARLKHQNMWGSHLFDAAEKAEERRLYRSSRRRLERRRKRINLLQNFFKDEISKVDPLFFERLKESMLQVEDKNIRLGRDLNILFNDDNFKDRDFFKKYPTIYHLRSDLVHSSDRHDIRLVYLALHHIIKYRGNFLVEGSTEKVAKSDNSEVFDELMEILNVDLENREDIKEIIQNEDLNASTKSSHILSLMNINKENKNYYQEVIKAIVGLKADAQKIFNDIDNDPENKDRFSFKFSESNYEEKRDKLAEDLGDDKFEFIEKLEAVYNWMVFSRFVKPGKTLSDIMVDKYQDYLEDLKSVKRLYRKYLTSKEYNNFFKNIKKGYSNYALYDDFHNKVNLDDLYKTIKKELSDRVDEKDPDWCRFESRSGLGEFLKRQRIRENGAIPRQIHQYEMKRILENQANFYPFLKDNLDKIISIHEFRLPYYIGPLSSKSSQSGKSSEFSWAVRKEGGAITPWNFNEKIDDMKSAENFINRMRNDCTYLPGEATLAKNSLLYNEFNVRNELANIRIGGKKLSANTINQIYEGLFVQNNTKVSKNRLLKFLDDQQIPYLRGEITGLSGSSFNSDLKSYHDFMKIGFEPVGKNRQIVEKIIEWITIFEDKKILIKKINQEYGNLFSKDQINKIAKLNYKGWGRLSRELLDGGKIINHRGETIIQVMRETGKNFMQISQKEDSEFKEIIEKYIKNKFNGRIQYSDIQSLAGSPGIKRSLWRSVRIINEIEDIMGYPPKFISLEFAREEQQKGVKTSTRKKQLEKMLRDLEDDKFHSREINQELKEYESYLNKKRFYLYFLQNGKCIYTGKNLDIEKLDSYEIDHIIPRSLVKDDSLDNTVLVLRTKNQEKLDEYPINPDIQKKQIQYWRSLKKAGMMSESKFKRLTETSKNSEYLGGFIQRQLVETRQIIKHLAVLLSEQYKESDTRVFAIRSRMSSKFRDWQDIPKSREINDFHHAKDAYLAVVLANFIDKEFTDKGLTGSYLYGEYERFYGGKNKRWDRDRTDDFILSAFYRKDKNVIDNVIVKTMWYNDCLVTRKTEFGDKAFYNANLSRSNSGDKMIPRGKNLNVLTYGGYNNEEKGALIGVRFKDKGQLVERLVNIPSYILSRHRNDKNAIESYIYQNYRDGQIITNLIPKRQKIIRDGQMQYIISADEVKSAVSLKLNKEIELNISKLLKNAKIINDELKIHGVDDLESQNLINTMDDFYDIYLDKLEKYYPIYKKELDKLKNLKLEFRNSKPHQKFDLIKRFLRTTKPMDGLPGMASAHSSIWKVGFNQKNSQKINLDNTEFVFESITGLRRRIIKGKDLKIN